MVKRDIRSVLKQRNRREQFDPTWLGVWLNTAFLARRALRRAIAPRAKAMQGRLLDFGCGRKPYRDLFSVSEYIGLDTHTGGHDHAGEDVDTYYEGRALPFEDNSFDAVFSSQVLEHVVDIDLSLSELFRVIRPGGQILATLPFVWCEHEQPHDFRRYTTFGIEALLARHGFTQIEVDRSGSAVETVTQLWIACVVRRWLPRAPFLRRLLVPILVTPWTLVALLLSHVLAGGDTLYLDNVVTARKPD
jgi:SAM-dependent methyltransferase